MTPNPSQTTSEPLPPVPGSAVELAMKLRENMRANQHIRRCRCDELHKDGYTIEAAAEKRVIDELEQYCEMLLRVEHDYRVAYPPNADGDGRREPAPPRQ